MVDGQARRPEYVRPKTQRLVGSEPVGNHRRTGCGLELFGSGRTVERMHQGQPVEAAVGECLDGALCFRRVSVHTVSVGACLWMMGRAVVLR